MNKHKYSSVFSFREYFSLHGGLGYTHNSVENSIFDVVHFDTDFATLWGYESGIVYKSDHPICMGSLNKPGKVSKYDGSN